MTDLSSAIATGIATKIAGLSAAAILAAIVVMAITPPKTFSEFLVGLISTVMASLTGGAALVRYMDLTELVNDPFGLATIGGIMFICGLPGWLLVRAFFLWAQRRRHMDLAELLKDAKRGYRGDRNDR
ncbi:MAG TPA: hypothetical protein V6D27_08315 [Vampirovibrionales bacterium]